MSVISAIAALSIVVLAVLAWMIAATLRGNKAFSLTEYDERQEAARGKAFRDGFFALLIANLLLYFWGESLPGSPRDWFLGALCLGLVAVNISLVARDAYVGLHQKPFPYASVLAAGGVLQFILYYDSIADGELKLANLFLSLTMIAPLVTLLLRCLTRPREEDEE